MDIKQKIGFTISGLFFVMPFLVTFLPPVIYSDTVIFSNCVYGESCGLPIVLEDAPPLAKLLFGKSELHGKIAAISMLIFTPLIFISFIYTLLFLDPTHRNEQKKEKHR
jgi:hypothetical protein